MSVKELMKCTLSLLSHYRDVRRIMWSTKRRSMHFIAHLQMTLNRDQPSILIEKHLLVSIDNGEILFLVQIGLLFIVDRTSRR